MTTFKNIKGRTYFDSFDDVSIIFYSDAPQKIIDSLSFNGDWNTVRHILIDWGYKVLDEIYLN